MAKRKTPQPDPVEAALQSLQNAERISQAIQRLIREQAFAEGATRVGERTPAELRPRLEARLEALRRERPGITPDDEVTEVIVPVRDAEFAFAYLIRPSRLAVSQALRAGLDEVAQAEILFANCWVDGDPRFHTHDRLFLTLRPSLLRLLELSLTAQQRVFLEPPTSGASPATSATPPSSATPSTSIPGPSPTPTSPS